MNYKFINDRINERQISRLEQTASRPCFCINSQLCNSCIAKTALEELNHFKTLEERVDKIIQGAQ